MAAGDGVALPPLPPLDTPAEVLEGTHRGPTFRSNWLVPGHILAGDRASLDEDGSLRAVLATGISTIVCLQTRQETKAAVDYRRNKALIERGVGFHECPIVDQQVAEDGMAEALTSALAERVLRGEILYVHCRGGHGRTGTVCALLLGRLYGLGAAEALARVQLCHDTRVQPCFAARREARVRLLSGDMSACNSLFPVQQAQVMRLLTPPPPAEEDDALLRWRAAGEEAAAAMRRAKAAAPSERRCELLHAAAAFREACACRPDFARGHVGLARALRLAGEIAEASQVLQEARARWPENPDVLEEMQALPAPPNGPQASVSAVGAANALPDKVESEASSADGSERGSERCEAASAVPAPGRPGGDRRPPAAAPPFVMLVGLPGSGKSTFGSQLVASSACWDRICQDELGGRAAVENALGAAAKDPNRRVILDRCNVDPADRRYLLELAFRPEGAVCVFFAASREECEARVAARTDHPTIRYGGGRRAVRSMSASLCEPSVEEGFREVIAIRDFRQADDLLRHWGAEPPEVPPAGLFALPPAPRLGLGPGPAARGADESPAMASALERGAAVAVEEMAGGAVCGVSLTSGYELRVQSGARYLDLETLASGERGAGPWCGLAEWLAEEEGSVLSLLEPEKEVLFGEWCPEGFRGEGTPACFLASDIYNKSSARFCSTRVRDDRLAGSGLQAAPRLAGPRPLLGGREELLELLRQPSTLRPGSTVRGLQLRLDEPLESGGGLWLELRAQVLPP